MMKRDECFRVLARHVTDEVVVVDLQLGGRLAQPRRAHAQLLFRSVRWGSTPRTRWAWRSDGPDKRIICLQGDGSLLMNLGCLVTIARGRAEEPRPYRGARTAPTRPTAAIRSRTPKVDFAAMARAGRLRPRARLLASLPISSSRPPTSSSRTGRCSRRCTSSRTQPLTYDYPNLYAAGAAQGARRPSCSRTSSAMLSGRVNGPWRHCAVPPASGHRQAVADAELGQQDPRLGRVDPRSSAAACARRCADNGCRADAASPTPP